MIKQFFRARIGCIFEQQSLQPAPRVGLRSSLPPLVEGLLPQRSIEQKRYRSFMDGIEFPDILFLAEKGEEGICVLPKKKRPTRGPLESFSWVDIIIRTFFRVW